MPLDSVAILTAKGISLNTFWKLCGWNFLPRLSLIFSILSNPRLGARFLSAFLRQKKNGELRLHSFQNIAFIVRLFSPLPLPCYLRKSAGESPVMRLTSEGFAMMCCLPTVPKAQHHEGCITRGANITCLQGQTSLRTCFNNAS